MAIKDCFNDLLKELEANEKVKPEFKDKVSRVKESLDGDINRLKNIYERELQLSPEDALNKAEQDAISGYLKTKKMERHATAMQAKRLTDNQKAMRAHPDGPTAGLAGILRYDVSGKSGQQGLEQLIQGTYAHATHKLDAFIEEFRSKIPSGIDTYFRGRQTKLKELNRALRGESVADIQVKGFADNINQSRKVLFDRLRAAGVHAQELDNYGMAQNYNMVTTQKLGKKGFRDLFMPRLDRTKMLDEAGNILGEEDLLKMVDDGFDTITTGGLNKLVKEQKAVPTKKIPGGIASKRSAHRVFHFKSADDALAVHEAIGMGDIYDNLLDELDHLATDVAIAETMGPKPWTNFQILNNEAKLAKAGQRRKITEGVVNNEQLFKELTGVNDGIANFKTADAMSALRSTTAAVRLDRATLASVADVSYSKIEADILGLSYRKVFGEYVNQIARLDKKARRQTATRLGLVVDWAHGNAAVASRFNETDVVGRGSKAAAMFADSTLRGTGLSAHTRNGKGAFMFGIQDDLYFKRHKSFNKLPEETRDMFKSHGVSSKEWDLLRKTKQTLQGEDFLDPDQLDPRLASKFFGMLNSHVVRAVPEPNAEVRALFKGGAARGTARRELGTSVVQFKSFPTQVMLNNLQNLTRPNFKTKPSKFLLAAKTLTYTTLLGGLAIQLREMSKGNEPMDPNTKEFWFQAASYGGGLGPLVDVPVDPSTPASVKAGRIIGAPIMLGLQGLQIAGEGFQDIVGDGKKLKTPKNILDIAEQVVPGSNLWYSSLALQRMIFDPLRLKFDKDFRKRTKRWRKRLNKEGRDFWWDPGTK